MALRYMSKNNIALVCVLVATVLFVNWAEKASAALDHHHWFRPGSSCYEICVSGIRHDCLHSCSGGYDDSSRCGGRGCDDDDDDDDDDDEEEDDDDDDDDDDDNRSNRRNRNNRNRPRCEGRSCPGNNNDDDDEEEDD